MIILGLILAFRPPAFRPVLWIMDWCSSSWLILWIAGIVGNGVGGRRHYYSFDSLTAQRTCKAQVRTGPGALRGLDKSRNQSRALV